MRPARPASKTEGRSASFYASRNGVGLTIARITAVRLADPLVYLRTSKSETFVVASNDLFAGAVEGTAGPARKAGFVLAGIRGARGASAVSFGSALGFVAGSVLRIRRREVEARLLARGIPRPDEVADAMYRGLGEALVELLGLVRDGSATTPILLTPRAELALASLGEGAVIASAHTGSWDSLACAMAQRVPLALVTKRLSVRFLDQVWQDIRTKRGLVLLHGAGTMRAALALLAEGRVVATMIDQAPRRGLVLPFLGKDALHDTMPAVLAHRARRPFVVALGRRDEEGRHVIDVPLVLSPDGSPARTFVPYATRLASDALGELVRAHPEQWLWLHRRWKGFEKAAPP